MVLTILGSLALFIFGMKLLSESLQRLAGEKMRFYLSTLTSNRWRGLFTGLIITGTIQSSSASTVMLIGFVNAGLISVSDSIGLVLGANIGTTITSWLLTFFGFSFNVSNIALPLMALSFPLYFSSKSKHKSLAEFIFGFTLLFIGLQFLRDSLPPINPSSPLVQYLSSTASQKSFSLIAIAIMGILITLLVQSSTATIALTTVLLADGYIDFEVAAALIIGENIGTTGTANLAAIFSNRNGKRTALIHFLFNLAGALLILPFFRYAVQGVEFLSSFLLQNSDNDLVVAPLKISLFHSLFNIINALIWINFTSYLLKAAQFVIKPTFDVKEENVLKYNDNFITPISEISIVQATKELQVMSLIIERMFKILPEMLLEKDEVKFKALSDEIYSKESVIDKVEKELNRYLSKISENKLSEDGSRLINAITISVNNLESMADVCYKLARTIEKKNEMKAWFTQDQRNNLEDISALVNNSLVIMQLHLSTNKPLNSEEAEKNEAAINIMRIRLVEQNMKDLQENKYPVISGNYYQQMIVYYEKLADHAINVVEAVSHGKKNIKKTL
jgi:phosphate:Na+ symporter